MVNGLLFFDEMRMMSFSRLAGFVFVWVAVMIFIVSEYRRYQAQVRLMALSQQSG